MRAARWSRPRNAVAAILSRGARTLRVFCFHKDPFDETRSFADRGGVGVVGDGRPSGPDVRQRPRARRRHARRLGRRAVNDGRFGFFSDIYYDPTATSGGRCRTAARAAARSTTRRASTASRSTSNKHTGAISNFQVRKTLIFRHGAQALQRHGARRRRPARRRVRSGRHRRASADRQLLIVSDEYGPSVYEFTPWGQLVRAYEIAGEPAAAQRRDRRRQLRERRRQHRGQAHQSRLRRPRDSARTAASRTRCCKAPCSMRAAATDV